jgi:glyoxylate/hydroxypyruvate reductase A
VIEADVVSSVVPDHPLTRKIFDEKCLKLFKPEAVFLNFGRGSVVDEEALSLCLMNNMIGSAVIDVTMDGPLPKDHPFWKCPKTIITQHSAGGTEDEIYKKISWFSDNLNHFLRGKKLISPANFELGF